MSDDTSPSPATVPAPHRDEDERASLARSAYARARAERNPRREGWHGRTMPAAWRGTWRAACHERGVRDRATAERLGLWFPGCGRPMPSEAERQRERRVLRAAREIAAAGGDPRGVVALVPALLARVPA